MLKFKVNDFYSDLAGARLVVVLEELAGGYLIADLQPEAPAVLVETPAELDRRLQYRVNTEYWAEYNGTFADVAGEICERMLRQYRRGKLQVIASEALTESQIIWRLKRKAEAERRVKFPAYLLN